MTKRTLNDLIINFKSEISNEKVLIFLNAVGEEISTYTWLELRDECVLNAQNLTKFTEKGDFVLLSIEEQELFTVSFFRMSFSRLCSYPLASAKQ